MNRPKWLISIEAILIFLANSYILYKYYCYCNLRPIVKSVQTFPNRTFSEYGYIFGNVSDTKDHSPTPSWQTIAHNYSYIFSAFIDDREGNRMYIKAFIAIKHSLRNSVKFYCHIWYENRTNPVVVKGTVITRHHKTER